MRSITLVGSLCAFVAVLALETMVPSSAIVAARIFVPPMSTPTTYFSESVSAIRLWASLIIRAAIGNGMPVSACSLLAFTSVRLVIDWYPA